MHVAFDHLEQLRFLRVSLSPVVCQGPHKVTRSQKAPMASDVSSQRTRPIRWTFAIIMQKRYSSKRRLISNSSSGDADRL